MKLTIEATSLTEYNIWSGLQSNALDVILLPENERKNKIVLKQHILNSVPFQYKDYSGKGFYLIKELGYSTIEDTGRNLYYALCLYKSKANEPFNNKAEVVLYLNPLYIYSSIGRKDIALERLEGATIEVQKTFVTTSYTRKKSYLSFNYKWAIVDFPNKQDNSYIIPVQIPKGEEISEDELAFLDCF